MRPLKQTKALCPHLAAAALWMSRPNRLLGRTRAPARTNRCSGAALDDLIAL